MFSHEVKGSDAAKKNRNSAMAIVKPLEGLRIAVGVFWKKDRFLTKFDGLASEFDGDGIPSRCVFEYVEYERV
jgi:hypothetical protein